MGKVSATLPPQSRKTKTGAANVYSPFSRRTPMKSSDDLNSESSSAWSRRDSDAGLTRSAPNHIHYSLATVGVAQSRSPDLSRVWRDAIKRGAASVVQGDGREGEYAQDELGRVRMSSEPQMVHRKLSPDMVAEPENEATPEMEQQLSSGRGGGEPLSEPVRTELGARLGADFSNVRVHSGGAVEGMTARMNARALTVGEDIYFGANQLDPASRKGRWLLAHELTHVVQQGAVPRTDGGLSSVRAPSSIQPSFISFALKMGAKKASKAMLKKFVKEQIKDKVEKIAIKKFAKQFAKEADDLISILDDPWWVTAIGFVPVVGDAFDLVHVPKQIAKAMKKADQLEEKVKRVLQIQGRRASDLIPASLTKSPSFHAELADKTYAEIVRLAGSSERAAQMKKLIEQTERLMAKVN